MLVANGLFYFTTWGYAASSLNFLFAQLLGWPMMILELVSYADDSEAGFAFLAMVEIFYYYQVSVFWVPVILQLIGFLIKEPAMYSTNQMEIGMFVLWVALGAGSTGLVTVFKRHVYQWYNLAYPG